MAEIAFNNEKEFNFNETTDNINVIPEINVTYEVFYGSRDNWTPDENNPWSVAVVIPAKCTRLKIVPTGGYVTVAGGGVLL